MKTEDNGAVGVDSGLIFRMEGLIEDLVMLREQVMDGPLPDINRNHVRAGIALLAILGRNLFDDITDEGDPQADPEVLVMDVQVFRVLHIIDLVHVVPKILPKLEPLTELDVERLTGLNRTNEEEIQRVVDDLIELGVGPLKRLHSRAIVEAVAQVAGT